MSAKVGFDVVLVVVFVADLLDTLVGGLFDCQDHSFFII